MRAVKKINNNVAICLDGRDNELIAFGRGIGFPSMPYKIEDLSKISRTFYNISKQYLALLNEIPIDIIEFTAQLVIFAENHLPYTLNPNLVLTLADHISFAIERKNKQIYVRMPLAFDMEQTYPTEVEIGRFALKQLQQKQNITLPESEVFGIAMAIVFAKLGTKNKETSSTKQSSELLEEITCIVEQQMGLQISRDSFNYARYATHMQYLLQRLGSHKPVSSDNLTIYHSLQEEFTDVSACVDKIAAYFATELGAILSDEERLYLILHVNRICTNEST